MIRNVGCEWNVMRRISVSSGVPSGFNHERTASMVPVALCP